MTPLWTCNICGAANAASNTSCNSCGAMQPQSPNQQLNYFAPGANPVLFQQGIQRPAPYIQQPNQQPIYNVFMPHSNATVNQFVPPSSQKPFSFTFNVDVAKAILAIAALLSLFGVGIGVTLSHVNLFHFGGPVQANCSLVDTGYPAAIVKLFQYANYTGQELCFTGTGKINLSDYGFDKQTQSLQSNAQVTFYTDQDCQGASFGLPGLGGGPEMYSYANLGAWDNVISSFNVQSTG